MKDDGGFAFPKGYSGSGSGGGDYRGMTLRDWFAGMVLPNIIHENSPDIAAEWAYQVADAMLKERGKTLKSDT